MRRKMHLSRLGGALARVYQHDIAKRFAAGDTERLDEHQIHLGRIVTALNQTPVPGTEGASRRALEQARACADSRHAQSVTDTLFAYVAPDNAEWLEQTVGRTEISADGKKTTTPGHRWFPGGS